MCRTIVGLVVGVVLGIAAAAGAGRGWLYAQAPQLAPISQGNGLIALTATGAEGRQQITLVDPQQRVICVYHVDPERGELALRSVRNVRWDLLLETFNGASPAPEEIRSLLEAK